MSERLFRAPRDLPGVTYGKVFQPTANLKIVRHNLRDDVIKQAWREIRTGEIEWRLLPVENEPVSQALSELEAK